MNKSIEEFKGKAEPKNVRDLNMRSDAFSTDSYEIYPYAMKPEPQTNFLKLFFGAFACFLGIIVMIVGLEKKTKNEQADVNQYWIISFIFIVSGTLIMFNAASARYRLLDSLS